MNKNCDNDSAKQMNEWSHAYIHILYIKKEKIIIGKVNKMTPVDVVVVDIMYLLNECCI